MNKLSRRDAFAAAAGGAVAAASAKRAAMPDYPPATQYYGGTEASGMPKEDPFWKADQLAKLKRLAAGDIRDEDRSYPTAGPPPRFESLKSVSEEARRYMVNNRIEREWRERTIKAALDALDNYDKTGILRTFF